MKVFCQVTVLIFLCLGLIRALIEASSTNWSSKPTEVIAVFMIICFYVAYFICHMQAGSFSELF